MMVALKLDEMPQHACSRPFKIIQEQVNYANFNTLTAMTQSTTFEIDKIFSGTVD